MNKAERDALLKETEDIDDQLYPKKGDGPSGKEYQRLHKLYYQKLEEYFERLPRVAMSVCPYCGQVLKRSVDPFGLDGPWWGEERLVDVREPKACRHFKVLLGAFKVRPGDPVEATHNVRPGPDVPFVVPRLLELPGMIAVVGRIELDTGDRVSFRVREDGVVEMVPETLDVMSLFGLLKPKKKGVSLEDMEDAISREASGK